MKRGSIAARFAAGAVLFACFMIPWPSLLDLYAHCLRWCCEASFAVIGFEEAEFRLEHPEWGRGNDLLVRFPEPGTDGIGFAVRSRLVGYFPLAILLAFVAVTPLSRGRRLAAALSGALLVQVCAVWRIGMRALGELTRHAGQSPGHDHPSFLLSDSWKRTVAALLELQANPGTQVLVPLVLWALVARLFRPCSLPVETPAVPPAPGARDSAGVVDGVDHPE